MAKEEIIESDGLTEVPAKEILEKMEKGALIEYDHVAIIGDLDIYSLSLHKLEDKKIHIRSPIKITNSEIRGKTELGDAFFEDSVNFDGTTFIEFVFLCFTHFEDNVSFNNSCFCESASFIDTLFRRIASFRLAEFYGDSPFNSVFFEGYADFNSSYFDKDADFTEAKFKGDAIFSSAQIFGKASFLLSTFYMNAYFIETEFENSVDFNGSKFKKHAIFNGSHFHGKSTFWDSQFYRYTLFYNSSFDGEFLLDGARFKEGILDLRGAKIQDSKSREASCRLAKKFSENKGDRENADYYFYQEMDARRQRKSWYIQCFELFFVRLIFGYGIHPFRLMAWWLLSVACFGIYYWAESGINNAMQPFDYIKFSFATSFAPGYIVNAISPGYMGYQPIPKYQAMAMIEAIFGTFMWAAFITTFARKYMR